jgi:hypothetical protein
MKSFHKIFSILLIAGMMLGWTASGSILASAPQSIQPQTDSTAKFESLALDQLTAGNADFFVTMAKQAELSKADQLLTKEEKGQYVFQALITTADRTQADLRAYLDKQGIEYQTFYIVNTILVKAGNLDLAMAIAGRKDVAQISVNHLYQLEKPMVDPNAPDVPTGIEPNISYVNAPAVWAMGINGSGTIMAGNDTGLDEAHPAIAPHYRGCVDPPACTTFDNNYNWWDATGTYPNDPWDGFGHGTHTTGTMVGDDGGDNQIGMAPGAQTIHCKNMTDGGSGDDNTFLTCFEWDLAPWDLNHQNPLPNMAPDAINNSWGYWGGGANQFRTAINNLQSAGILVEVSAGNEGTSCSTLRSPGDYWEVLTTGSINHAVPYPGTITGFSSRGPSSLDPGYYFPDIMAPGENIRSSIPGGSYEGGWSGTSMAGPHATALVGLIWSAAPALRGQVAQTIEIIHETSVPLTGQGGSNCGGDYSVGPNNDWGFGTIDALAAVQLAIAMGGAGQLNGTVTDSTSGDPIGDANIQALHQDGFAWDDQTDATGYYTMTVAAGTYTVTASAYGYATDVIYPVDVITDEVTLQDIALTALPTHIVSGHIYDSVSGDPLEGTVEFTDAPVPPVNTDPNGFYSLTVAEGTWTMLATAASHSNETLQVEVNSDITVDFNLDPLPCILLVDDDQNGPDVQSSYTEALDNLGYGYNLWDVSSSGDPGAGDLVGYRHILWFTGYPYSNTFNGSNEAAVGTYMDGGGNFFLSSQDYLYEAGLTQFGQNYLHVLSFTSDINQTTVAGQNVFSGLGPYTLSYPFTNYSDIVNPDGQAQLAFSGNVGNAAVSYDGANFNSVFLGYPFEAIPQLADRVAVMERTVGFFGGCEPPADISINPPEQSKISSPGMQVSYVYTVTNVANVVQEVLLSLDAIWPTEAPATTGDLEAGASTTLTVTVTIPTIPGVIIASDTFTLTATGVVGGDDIATGTTLVNVNPGGEVIAPEGDKGRPLEVIPYEFMVTNTGDYTDSFALTVSGVWTATLPGGDNTGLLAPGASTTVTVLVEVPEGASDGDFDVTTLKITSQLDISIWETADVTTTAILSYYNLMPIILK